MKERLHQYLDGELQREELTAEELREVALYETAISEIENISRAFAVPDLTAAVQARIERTDVVPHRSGGVKALLGKTASWLWAPRAVQFRPAYAGLTAVLLFLLIIPGIRVPNVVPMTGKVFVQFRLDTPQAKTVRLAGNFNGWEPTYTLQQVKPGTWSILIPLDPGVYNYVFVVNEAEWLADPAAPAVADGFGGVNSRLSVLLPGEI